MVGEFWCVWCCKSVFFFKQKTAYELRISDWSSDVCSSDLLLAVLLRDQRADLGRRVHRIADLQALRLLDQAREEGVVQALLHEDAGAVGADLALGVEIRQQRAVHRVLEVGVVEHDERRLAASSEEHTHELQTLIGIS